MISNYRSIDDKLAREAREKDLSYEDYLLVPLEEEVIPGQENALKRRIKKNKEE